MITERTRVVAFWIGVISGLTAVISNMAAWNRWGTSGMQNWCFPASIAFGVTALTSLSLGRPNGFLGFTESIRHMRRHPLNMPWQVVFGLLRLYLFTYCLIVVVGNSAILLQMYLAGRALRGL